MEFEKRLADCQRLFASSDPLADAHEEDRDTLGAGMLALAELLLSARPEEVDEVRRVGRNLDWAPFVRSWAKQIKSTEDSRSLRIALAGASIDGGFSDFRDLAGALDFLRTRAMDAGFSVSAIRVEAGRIAPNIIDRDPPWPDFLRKTLS